MPHPTLIRALLLVLLLLLASACGGSASPDDGDEDPGEDPPLPDPEIILLVSDPSRDGFVTTDGVVSVNGLLRVGDTTSNGQSLGFLVFHLAESPALNRIVRATLEVREFDIRGTPYADLGAIRVAQVDLGVGLDAGDVSAPVLLSSVGTLSASAAPVTNTMDVTSFLKSNLSAGRSRIDLRLAFDQPTDEDGVEDSMGLNDGLDTGGAGQPSRIIVEYR